MSRYRDGSLDRLFRTEGNRRDRNVGGPLCGDLLAPFLAPTAQRFASARGFHPRTETNFLFAASPIGLIGAFHRDAIVFNVTGARNEGLLGVAATAPRRGNGPDKGNVFAHSSLARTVGRRRTAARLRASFSVEKTE